MKTQVIQLSQNEDYVSVREKISWSQADRILLVWPEKGRLLDRPLDLNLIKRHATSLGAQLWLVTGDEKVRFYAHKLGIKVVDGPPKGDDVQLSENRLRQDLLNRKITHSDLVKLRQELHPSALVSPTRPIVRILCLSICALAILSLAIWILPGAKISLTPQIESQAMIFDLVADPAAKSINYSSGVVPAYYQEVIVTAHDVVKTTGTVSIPDKRAIGNLRFTNSSDQSITIPVGTKVYTSGINPIVFITTSAKDEQIPPNSSIFIQAQAMNPGSIGNLPPEELTEISVDAGSGLTVTNPQATSGGTDVEVPSPSSQDLANLHHQLLGKVVAGAQVQLRSLLPQGEFLITPTITAVETLEETQFPAIGDPGSQLNLSLRVRVQSQVVSGSILQGFINPIMDSYTPVGYLSLPGSLTYKDSKITGLNSEGNYHLSMVATREVQPAIPGQRLLNLIKGKTISRALNELSVNMPMAGQAHIQVFPTWWPWLPFLTSRIELEQAVLK